MSIFILYKLEEGGFGLLFLASVVFALSYWIPGFPSLVALFYVASSILLSLYVITLSLLRSDFLREFFEGYPVRVFSLVIAGLPVVGAYYYVPTAMNRAGIVSRFGGNPAHSPIAPQLLRLDSGLREAYPKTAVVSYQIRDNRLYADIARDGIVQSIELNTSDLVNTGIPWLERDLSRKTNAMLGPSATGLNDPGYSRMAGLLAPVAASLAGCETVLIADGAVQNFPHQSALIGKRVLRSTSLEERQLRENVSRWARSGTVRVGQIQVLNALPRSREELARLGLVNSSWENWQGQFSQFAGVIPGEVAADPHVGPVTKSAVLEALQKKECVLLVIAHCDGLSIRLPNGEFIHVNDLDEISETIRANRPRVFLFSCETARASNVRSFAKVLLDHGAQAVVAPVIGLSTREAAELFKAFINNVFSNSPLPIEQAFLKAMDETGKRTMEVWLAQFSSLLGLLPT